MTKKKVELIYDGMIHGDRHVGFSNGVMMEGEPKAISEILNLINRIGKVLKEAKSGRDQGSDRVRKGSPAKPGRKSNAMPKMQGRSRSK